ncbi:MAG: sensor histidine kinase [Candidatus Dormibacteria bacterium]
MSIRLRLLLGLIALVAIGLAATDAVTYLALQSSLSSRLNQQLLDSRGTAQACIVEYSRVGLCPPDASLPQGSWAALVSASGPVLTQIVWGSRSSPTPLLPPKLSVSASGNPVFLTVPATKGGGQFRVVISSGPGADVLLVAMPLAGTVATLGQLSLLEAIVSVAVLTLLGVAAWWTVQLGLRPLARIRNTAQKIAAGDLAQRVDSTDPRTEVGQLGISLNEMLAQIEEAFDARSASEDRLRQFVADASHELRTPLSSIRGYAELFHRGASANPADLAKAMSRIESESIRMGQLVDDLLMLARLDEGRPLELKRVDLSQLAVDAGADQAVADRQHPISVVAPEPVRVAGDEARLRQVITNLVRNAVVHTPDGTGVEILTRTGDARGILQVVDHGPGVPPEAAGRIFERFVRVDRSRGRARGGAGLGLAIVAAIVSSHHGELTLETTPGGGATFQVEIPTAFDQAVHSSATPAGSLPVVAAAGPVAEPPGEGGSGA